MGASLTGTVAMLVVLAVSAIDVTLVAVVLGLAVLGLPRARVISFALAMPVTVAVVGTAVSVTVAHWWQASSGWSGSIKQAPFGPLMLGSSAPTWLLGLQAAIAVGLILGATLAWLKAPQVQSLLRKALSSRAAEAIGPLLHSGVDTLKRIPGSGLATGVLLAVMSLLDAPFFAALLVTSRLRATWTVQLPLWVLYGFVSTAPVLLATVWVRRLAPGEPLPGEADDQPHALGGSRRAGVALHSAAPLLRFSAGAGALMGVVLIAQVAFSWLA